LVGGPNQLDDEMLAANHGSVLIALAAAREARVRRFILVSAPGAAVDAEHPYLRAKGLAEEAVANSGIDHAIVRSTHAYGLGGLWFTSVVEGSLASSPFVVGDGAQELAPVFAHDLAAVLEHPQPRPLGGVPGVGLLQAVAGDRRGDGRVEAVDQQLPCRGVATESGLQQFGGRRVSDGGGVCRGH
jgi:uncharacterized protein YbjT (DUF2867 family)